MRALEAKKARRAKKAKKSGSCTEFVLGHLAFGGIWASSTNSVHEPKEFLSFLLFLLPLPLFKNKLSTYFGGLCLVGKDVNCLQAEFGSANAHLSVQHSPCLCILNANRFHHVFFAHLIARF